MKYLINNFKKLKYWLRNHEDLRFSMNKLLWDSGSPFVKLNPTPLENIIKLDQNKESIILKNLTKRKRGMSLEVDELLYILLVVKEVNPRRVLEIGTYDGNTTLNIAANISSDSKVVTIDLPPEGLEEESFTGKKNPEKFHMRQYLDTEEADKVNQIYGDSAELDFSQLGGPFDLIFIDGDHSRFYALNDTRKSLSVLNPGGVILWHDYEMQSVSSVLDSSLDTEKNISWIKGSRLAIGFFDNPKKSINNFISI